MVISSANLEGRRVADQGGDVRGGDPLTHDHYVPLMDETAVATQPEGRGGCLSRFIRATSKIRDIIRKTTVKQRVGIVAATIAGIAAICMYRYYPFFSGAPTCAYYSSFSALVPATKALSLPYCEDQCSYAPSIIPPSMDIEYARGMGFLEPPDPSFNLDEFLGPVSFPRTIDNAERAFENAVVTLEKRRDQLLAIQSPKRTFENTVMAYHDMMVSFDAKERLVRSERVLSDETAGKQALLDRYSNEKEKVFSDSRLLNMFISYAEWQLTSKSALTSVEWQYLKGIVSSMKKEVMSVELQARWNQLKLALEVLDTPSYVYLKGRVVSKELLSTTPKNISYLTHNLCFMPETNPMIYGGLLPWKLRIAAIAKKIRSLNPDIVFLQEIYDIRALFELHKRLTNCFAHFYGNVTPRLFGLRNNSLLPSSGLAIISKFQLADLHFEPYRVVTENRPSGFDRLNLFGFDRNYGVFHGLVMSGKKALMRIATTHENPFYATVRGNQTRQIVELFARLAKNDTSIPLVLSADLNIEQGDLREEGERLINDNFRSYYHGGPTNLDFGDFWFKWNRSVQQFVAANHTYWTIDRSLLWSDWAKDNDYAMETERITMFDVNKPAQALSDHHGVLTRFSFT